MRKIHLRQWEGTAPHPRMRPACSPPWHDDNGRDVSMYTDNPMEVTCSACQRTKAWGDVITGRPIYPTPDWTPDVVAHRDADGMTRLHWRDDRVRETKVSRELLEQLVEQGNRLQRILKATQCDHDWTVVGGGLGQRELLYCIRCSAQKTV